MDNFPSQYAGRATYKTPKQGGNQVAPLSLPAVVQTVDYFELFARISHNAGMLPYLSVAFHPTTPIGVYVLLLDQIQTEDNANGAQMLADGDPALVTMGPTQKLGSIIVYSHADVEAPAWIEVGDPFSGQLIKRQVQGFPFDAGCIAVLSSTPGILTQLPPVQEVGVPGARFTARWQGCG